MQREQFRSNFRSQCASMGHESISTMSSVEKAVLTTILKSVSENAPQNPSSGYFIVSKSFSISPGGGWRISFAEGDLIRYANRLMKLEKFDPLSGAWKVVSPPISGTTTMDFTAYATWPEQRKMIDAFLANIKKVTEQKAESYKASMAAEKVVTVREAMNILSEKKMSDKVKITFL